MFLKYSLISRSNNKLFTRVSKCKQNYFIYFRVCKIILCLVKYIDLRRNIKIKSLCVKYIRAACNVNKYISQDDKYFIVRRSCSACAVTRMAVITLRRAYLNMLSRLSFYIEAVTWHNKYKWWISGNTKDSRGVTNHSISRWIQAMNNQSVEFA